MQKTFRDQVITASYKHGDEFASFIKVELDKWANVVKTRASRRNRRSMYDLHLSAEQLEIRDTVRDFVAQEIKPITLAGRAAG